MSKNDTKKSDVKKTLAGIQQSIDDPGPLEPSDVWRESCGISKRDIEDMITANTGVGRSLKDICSVLVHPDTGLEPTEEQLKTAFPNAWKPGLANMLMTTELYQTGRYGEKGDRVKAQIKWVESREPKKWEAIAQRMEITGKDGDAIQIKARAQVLVKKAGLLINGISNRIADAQIEASKKREDIIVHQEDYMIPLKGFEDPLEITDGEDEE